MRRPIGAGTLYPSDRDTLRATISGFMDNVQLNAREVSNATAYVAPHGAYKDSGGVAAYAYKALSMNKDLKKIDTFVILGPNHTKEGSRISFSKEDWQTPLGEVITDREFVEELLAMSVGAAENEDAHRNDLSIEAQLPFLQSIVDNPKCCMVSMLDQTEDASRAMATDIELAARRLNRRIMIIASSDLNHDESAEIARRKDAPILDLVGKMDVKGFYRELNNNLDSVCGFAPIAVAALYSKQRKAKLGKLLKYATSGDVTGNNSSVVSYASMAFV